MLGIGRFYKSLVLSGMFLMGISAMVSSNNVLHFAPMEVPVVKVTDIVPVLVDGDNTLVLEAVLNQPDESEHLDIHSHQRKFPTLPLQGCGIVR